MPERTRVRPQLILSVPSVILTLLVVLSLVGCSTEQVCPTGTTGTPCTPNSDLVDPPEVPSSNHAQVVDATRVSDDGQRHFSDTDIQGNDLIPTDDAGTDGATRDVIPLQDIASDAPAPGDAPSQDAADESPDGSGESRVTPRSWEQPARGLDQYVAAAALA